MKYLSHFLLSLTLAYASYTKSQVHDTYKPLRSYGTIPKVFTTLSSEKVKTELQTIEKNGKSRKDIKTEEKFVEEVHYGVDDMLLSGNVLYNDPVSNYVNQVVDKLLANNPELRNKLHFFTLRSNTVNAFCTHQGYIFVSTGLISKLSNEAQLAFILGHEISHYTEKHSLNSYVYKQDIVKGKGEYKKISFEKRLLLLYKYSKDHETEADEKGLEIFLKSGYSYSNIEEVFDILQHWSLPFDEIPFDMSFLESDFFKIPEKYKLKETKPIEFTEESDDKSTHPNISKRIASVKKILEKQPKDDGAKFLVSESQFHDIVRICRYEEAYLYIINGEFIKAMQHANLIEKTYGEGQYIRDVKAMALYCFTKSTNAKEIERAILDSESDKGEISAINNILRRLPKKEVNVIAVRAIADQYFKNPNSSFIRKLLTDAMMDLFVVGEFKKEDFLTEVPDSSQLKIWNDSLAIATKFQKVALQKKIKQFKTSSEYYTLAFIGLFKNDDFVKLLDSIEYASKIVTSNNYMSMNRFYKMLDKREKYGAALGIDTILAFAPQYSFAKVGKSKYKRSLKYNESEEQYIRRMYLEMAEENELKLTYLNYMSQEGYSTDDFNDFSLISSCLSEVYTLYGLNCNSLFMSHFSDTLFTKLNSGYIMISSINSYAVAKRFSFSRLITIPILWEIAPFYLYWQFSPKNILYHSYYVFDLKKGTLELAASKYYNTKASNDVMKSQTYHLMHQIKTAPKKQKAKK